MHEINSIKDVLSYRTEILRQFRNLEKNVLELQTKLDNFISTGKQDRAKKIQDELAKVSFIDIKIF